MTFKSTRAIIVRDKDGKVRLDPRLRANPDKIPPAIWNALTEEEKKELKNGNHT